MVALVIGALVAMLLMVIVIARQQQDIDHLHAQHLASAQERGDIVELLNELIGMQQDLTDLTARHEVSISRAYLTALQAKQEIQRLLDDRDGRQESVDMMTELAIEAVKEIALAQGPLFPYTYRNVVRLAAELHAYSFHDEPGSEAFQRRVAQFLKRCAPPQPSSLQVVEAK